MEKVSVNKGLLVGVVAIAGGALLAVAFLLGRASGTDGSSAPPSGTGPRQGPAVAPLDGTRATEEPSRAPAPASGASAGAALAEAWPTPGSPLAGTDGRGAFADPGPAPVPTGGGPAGAGTDPGRAAVAAYFDAVDRILAGDAGGDAESLANEMAMALAKGDSTGLDKMIRETEEARAKLAAVAPPAPCAALHRESLASADDSLEMLRSVKSAMESPDAVAQLAAVASRATALRSRAEGLQKEEQALRERYGLTR